jgi:hypothetical protein
MVVSELAQFPHAPVIHSNWVSKPIMYVCIYIYIYISQEKLDSGEEEMTLEFESDNTIFNRHNIDVSTIRNQVRPNLL